MARSGSDDEQTSAFDALLRALETEPGTAQAGPLAAAVIVLAASLLEEAARQSNDWADSAGAVAQAAAVRRRGLRLAREVREAHAAARLALADASKRPAADTPDARLGASLARAGDVPLEIAEAGGDAAGLAELVAAGAAADLRVDAAAAASLAAGAVGAAARLVEVNLSVAAEDPRRTRARELVELANEAAERAWGASG